MKTAFFLAILFAAFGIVGDIDYATAAALAAENTRHLPLLAAASQGGIRHGAR